MKRAIIDWQGLQDPSNSGQSWVTTAVSVGHNIHGVILEGLILMFKFMRKLCVEMAPEGIFLLFTGIILLFKFIRYLCIDVIVRYVIVTLRYLFDSEPRTFIYIRDISKGVTDIGTYTGTYSFKFFRKEVPHGEGVFISANGHEYNGQWSWGQVNGHGVFKWKNGDKHVSMWKKDQRNGQGVYKWENGDEYKGN